MSSTEESPAEFTMDCDRFDEIKAFDDSKAGVKGLFDAGIVNIPRIFIRSPDEIAEDLNRGSKPTLRVPVVDLSGIEAQDQRNKIVGEIRQASENWGFFILMNHGVPSSVLDGMLDGIRDFHEQDAELKKELYTRDQTRKVRYESNLHLYQSKTANWRDTLNISMQISGDIDPEEIPTVCRKTSIEYINHVTKLGETLFDLLSQALELKPDHLKAMECAKGRTFVCHYYPACPQPELTLGTDKHTDPAFLTILLQDQIGGLQVMYNDQWVDVEPIEGGLVVNVGDLLQILSNDKFVSVNHRVLANRVGPRMSVACFFTGVLVPPKVYGPIKELISEEKGPVYKEFVVKDYMTKFFSKPLHKSGLDLFKL